MRPSRFGIPPATFGDQKIFTPVVRSNLGVEMSRELVGNALGFIVLAIASLQFLSFSGNTETNFAIAIGFVLLLFA